MVHILIKDDDLSEGLLQNHKMQPHLERRRFSDSSDVCSSTPSSKPSINSATYTRPKVVDPQVCQMIFV